MTNPEQEGRIAFNQYLRQLSDTGSERSIMSVRELYELTTHFASQTNESFGLELRFMSSWAAFKSSFIVASNVINSFGQIEVEGPPYFDEASLTEDQMLGAESYALLLYALGIFSDEDEMEIFFHMPTDVDHGLPPLVTFDQDRETALYYHRAMEERGDVPETSL